MKRWGVISKAVFMKFIKSPEFIAAFCFVVFLALGIVSNITIENVVYAQGGMAEEVSLPFSREIEANTPFTMEFDIVNRYGLSYDMWIIPDDCADSVTVGKETLDLGGVRGHCDFSKGFLLTDSALAPLQQGENTHYSVSMHNGGGPGGMMAFVKMTSVVGEIVKILAMVSFTLLVVLVARRLRLGKPLIMLLFVGILFRCFFFMATPYKKFSMDVEGHIEYVQYILENHSIPNETDCWSCYHPPVYYVAAAPSYALSEFLGMPGTTGLQTFSLLLSVVTTFLGLLFLKKILQGRPLLLASILWIFWPLMIMVAPRIGNDQMFYMLHVLCMWAGIYYVKGGRGRYLMLALVSTALALWTKSTAVVTLGMFFVFAVCGLFTNDRFLNLTKSEVISWMLFVVLVAVFAFQTLHGPELVGNAHSLNSAMKVQNETYNYLYFDLKNFLESPFTSCWNSHMGRDFFWNFVLKTSLFGEWSLLENANGRFWATIMSVLLLGLLVYGARDFWKTRFNLVHWILLLQGVAFIAALMALRVKYAYACSSDFRYILPVLLSFCPFVAIGATMKGSSVMWKVVGHVIIMGFVVSSSVLYIMVM